MMTKLELQRAFQPWYLDRDFPELTTYVCLFTNLPPYTGGKK